MVVIPLNILEKGPDMNMNRNLHLNLNPNQDLMVNVSVNLTNVLKFAIT